MPRDVHNAIAIIDNPHYGLTDRDTPALQFEVNIPESWSAGLALFQPEADEVIKQADVRDVKDLQGRACFVNIENGIMKFHKMISRTGT